MNPDKPLQMIAVDDIGAFTALVFDDSQKYIGQAIEIAGDELTELQMTEVLAKVINHPVNLITPSEPPLYEDMVTMVNWFNSDGYEADIPALHTTHPALMTFDKWLRENGWGTGNYFYNAS